ncbi:MAG: sulfite exporter TauE/SafE family protein [Algicola sp.]|nr:sulfite exporter TauE/SafE family protein [Algicola sp.]
MLFELLPLVLLGFGLGMMHALDADHVMAVSALSNQKPSLLRTIWFSAHWAVGHGGVLLVSGLLLFGLGVAIPEYLQRFAEMSVGVLLIGLGAACFWQFRKEKIRFDLHSHGDIKHRHWHDEQHTTAKTEATHVPVMVGSLHGLAGSAPALALIPAVGQGDLTVVIGYLLVFSFGVMLSMMLFGFGLGLIQSKLKQRYDRFYYWSRRFVATTASVVGVIWLYQAI